MSIKSKKSKKIRLKMKNLRGMFLLGGFIVMICFTLGFKATAANLINTEGNNGQSAYLEVLVQKGDSLWGLTDHYYKGDEDIRKIIYRVKKINELEDAKIMPGQLLKIPQS